jgi:outer membrane protein assembly factor BamD (BamD/ComL family)
MERVRGLVKVLAAQKKTPNDLEANFAVGRAYVGLDHLRRAELYLQRACELDPRNEHGRLSQARLLLAVVPVEDGDSALALKNLAAFMEEFKDAPEIPAAMFFQGEILFGDAKMDPEKLLETRGVFDALRTRFPKNVKAYEADRAIDVIDARLRAIKAAAIHAPGVFTGG